jgi:uncharacterized protein YcbX
LAEFETDHGGPKGSGSATELNGAETKYGKTRSAQIKTSVFATCNNIKKMSAPLQSRFFIVELEPYTYEQFCDIDYTLSKVLGQDVSLMRASLEKPSYEEYWPDIDGLAQREKVTDETMPSQTFFDIAVIHLLTTSTINRLRELYPEGRFEVRRFRPNIVMESASGEKDFIENSWMGKKITLGEDIVLRVTGPCTRCVMTTLPQGDLPRDLGILHTVARYNQVNAGVYASVHRDGTIRRGDLMRVEG